MRSKRRWLCQLDARIIALRSPLGETAIRTASCIVLVLIATPAAAAAGSDCYSIKDANRKNPCLATSTSQLSHCHAIRDSDAKNMCLARLTLQKSYCFNIKAKDGKAECLGVFK